jgi:AhpD family alkylhydroperoxidase
MSLSQPHTFRRRHYRSPAELWEDLRRLAALRASGTVSPALRERLMLVVTSVNRCRYCAAFHTKAAQLSGLTAVEIALLLEGATEGAPAAELPALLYARHWAEAGGQASPELQAALAAHYGADGAAGIERVLRTIWVGNLLGNSWDALLFQLSGGRLGQERAT